MRSTSLWQFASDHLSKRDSLESTAIEYAGLQRGLSVDRVGNSSITLGIEGHWIPFHGLHGPDTSYMARQIGEDEEAQRVLAQCQGVPMVESDADAVVSEELFNLFVIDGRCVSAVSIERACVVGDGLSCVGGLIGAKNRERGFNPCVRDDPVPEEPGMLDALVTSGRDLSFVPKRGEQVVLRSARDRGTDFVDVMDTVDVDVIDLAVAAVEIVPGLPYAGVEIASGGDPRYVQLRRVLCPAPAIAQFPTSGKVRDVAGGIIEHYSRMPRWQRARLEKN